MNPTSLAVFYGVCGVLIAVLLVRIWFKKRTARRSDQAPVIPSYPSTRPAAATAASTNAAEVSRPVESVTTVPQVASPVHSASHVPEPYIASASATSSIYRSSAVPTWEDRRLLEHRGILTRSTSVDLPRVLAAEVPGADDSDRTFGPLNPVLACMLPESDQRREEARKVLNTAGYYNPHALENLAAVRYALIMLGIVFCGGLLLIAPAQLEPVAVAALVFVPILGWALPTLYIRRKAAERVHEISRAMPDLLDMLNMCVSQGLTVSEALNRILREFRGVYPALAQELSIVIDQSRINDLHTSLEAFGRRIDLPEVHSFTSLLIQTERMGTSITQALATYSDTMRESMKQRADEKGNRATFRLLFPTVLCLMPAVYMFLLGPAVNELSKFFNNGGSTSVDAGTSAIQRLNSQRGVNRPTP